LERHRRRGDRAVIGKEHLFAVHQRPCAERASHPLRIAALDFGGEDAGMRAAEEENWRKMVNMSGFLQC
jgi:hypothetical protein